MSRQLPAPRSRPTVELEAPPRRSLRRSDDREPGRPTPSWPRSPLGSALSDLAPDVVRLAGSVVSDRLRRRDVEAGNPTESKPGATGLTMSEVEINLSAPLIRRIVVRSATAWTIAPELLQAEAESGGSSRKRGRKLGAGVAGLAGLATVALAVRRRLGRRFDG